MNAEAWTDRTDIDVVTHEIVHVAQQAHKLPSWVVEGTADLLRSEYGRYNVSGGWSMVIGWAPDQNYTDGYGTAASFFRWIDANVGQDCSAILQRSRRSAIELLASPQE